MSFYTSLILVLAGVGVYLCLEQLLIYLLRRERINLLISFIALTNSIYNFFTVKIYQSTDPLSTRPWQLAQLIAVTFLFCSITFLGLDYLQRLKWPYVVILLGLAVLFSLAEMAPPIGLTSEAHTKHVSWLGITYHEVTLGTLGIWGTALMAIIQCLMTFLIWRNRRYDKPYLRVFPILFVIWSLASLNDALIAQRVYVSIYLLEYSYIFTLAITVMMVHVDSNRQTVNNQRIMKKNLQLTEEQLARVQADLVVAGKMAAVGRMASGVAHEVNNPLTYVLGKLESLYLGLGGHPELRHQAHEALHGAKRIKRVMRQLSAFTLKPPNQENHLVSGSVRKAVSEASRLAIYEIKDRASLHVMLPALPRVALDEAELVQIILNLLINAAHATKPGAREKNKITISARHFLKPAAVDIIVEDTGVGIDPSLMDKIFDPFFTTKAQGEGMGLGLSICRSLVNNAGGTIRAQNSAQGGARFSLQVPVAEHATELEDALVSDIGQLAKELTSELMQTMQPANPVLKKLLLVDDDADVLQVLFEMLSPAFEVTSACSGRDALLIIKQGQEFDYILCDLMMPDGSGVDVLEQLTKHYPHLQRRFIMMSGGVPEKERMALAATPKIPVISKPFSLRELQQTIGSLATTQN